MLQYELRVKYGMSIFSFIGQNLKDLFGKKIANNDKYIIIRVRLFIYQTMYTFKIMCCVGKKKFFKIVKILTTLCTCIYLFIKLQFFIGLSKVVSLNFAMYVLMILTCSLKIYVLGKDSLNLGVPWIQLKILFTTNISTCIYDCKKTHKGQI